MEPIVVLIGRQSDGCNYQLDPVSRRRITETFPGANIAPSVFVGYEIKADFERVHGPMWKQIASLLTGLTWEQLQALGGLEIYDPDTTRHKMVA